jgi:hypothetical protein
MKPTTSPPYAVTVNEFGDATISLALAFAETVQDQLRRHGFRSKLTVGKGKANSTLNFGRDADLPSIQQLIDSFSRPSPHTETGRPSSDWRHANGEE